MNVLIPRRTISKRNNHRSRRQNSRQAKRSSASHANLDRTRCRRRRRPSRRHLVRWRRLTGAMGDCEYHRTGRAAVSAFALDDRRAAGSFFARRRNRRPRRYPQDRAGRRARASLLVSHFHHLGRDRTHARQHHSARAIASTRPAAPRSKSAIRLPRASKSRKRAKPRRQSKTRPSCRSLNRSCRQIRSPLSRAIRRTFCS